MAPAKTITARSSSEAETSLLRRRSPAASMLAPRPATPAKHLPKPCEKIRGPRDCAAPGSLLDRDLSPDPDGVPIGVSSANLILVSARAAEARGRVGVAGRIRRQENRRAPRTAGAVSFAAHFAALQFELILVVGFVEPRQVHLLEDLILAA